MSSEPLVDFAALAAAPSRAVRRAAAKARHDPEAALAGAVVSALPAAAWLQRSATTGQATFGLDGGAGGQRTPGLAGGGSDLTLLRLLHLQRLVTGERDRFRLERSALEALPPTLQLPTNGFAAGGLAPGWAGLGAAPAAGPANPGGRSAPPLQRDGDGGAAPPAGAGSAAPGPSRDGGSTPTPGGGAGSPVPGGAAGGGAGSSGGGAGSGGSGGGSGGSSGGGGQGSPGPGGGSGPSAGTPASGSGSAAGGGGAPAGGAGSAPAGGFQQASAYTFAGGDDVKAVLDARADPTWQSMFDRKLGAADSLRISALSYSYYPSSFLYNVGQAIIPTDSFRDHWLQSAGDNAYEGYQGPGATYLSIAERVRGVLHLLGDVASTVAGIASVVAIGAGVLALVTSETVIGGLTFGAIAGIAATAATAAAIVKAILDLLDIVLGVIQILVLVHYAKNATPGQRAQIAQLLKKEASDLSQNVIQFGFEVVAIGVGAAVGGVAEKSTEPLKVWKAFGALKPSSLAGIVAKEGEVMAQRTALAAARLAIARAATPEEKLALGMRYPMLEELQLLSAKSALARMVAFQGVNLIPTVTLGAAQTQVKVTSGLGGTNPTVGSAAPAAPARTVTLDHVSVWPAVMDRMNTLRQGTHSAQERMVRQNDRARSDADPATVSQVDSTFGQIEQKGNRIQAASLAKQQEAAAEQQKHQQQADAAGKGAGPQKDAQAKGSDLDAKAKEAKAKADSGARPPDSGWHPFDALGSMVAGWQQSLNDWILKTALASAGMKPEDLDLAGIQQSAMDDHKKDEDNKQTAAQAGQQVDPIADKVAQMRARLSRDQQSAAQGMVDTMEFVNAMDQVDQGLAEDMQTGDTYIQQAAAAIKHELAVKAAAGAGPGAQIDPEYMAPVIDGVTDFQRSIVAAPDQLTQQGQQAVTDMQSGFAGMVPGGDFSAAIGVANQAVAGHGGALGKLRDSATQRAGALRDQARGFVGSTDYAGAAALAKSLEALMADWDKAHAEVVASLGAQLTKIHDQVVQGVTTPTPTPTPGGGQGGGGSGGGGQGGGGPGGGGPGSLSPPGAAGTSPP